MPKRKSLSKKIRFEVFKRDLFTCQYCGDHPPKAILEVDHIDPVCNGGDNSEENLITSCFDCNRGKAGNSLSVAPISITEKTKLIKEKQAQLLAYRKVKASQKELIDSDIDQIESCFTEYFDDRQFSESFRNSVKINFLGNLDIDDLCDYMNLACEAVDKPDGAIKYFCGICWRKINA